MEAKKLVWTLIEKLPEEEAEQIKNIVCNVSFDELFAMNDFNHFDENTILVDKIFDTLIDRNKDIVQNILKSLDFKVFADVFMSTNSKKMIRIIARVMPTIHYCKTKIKTLAELKEIIQGCDWINTYHVDWDESKLRKRKFFVFVLEKSIINDVKIIIEKTPFQKLWDFYSYPHYCLFLFKKIYKVCEYKLAQFLTEKIDIKVEDIIKNPDYPRLLWRRDLGCVIEKLITDYVEKSEPMSEQTKELIIKMSPILLLETKLEGTDSGEGRLGGIFKDLISKRTYVELKRPDLLNIIDLMLEKTFMEIIRTKTGNSRIKCLTEYIEKMMDAKLYKLELFEKITKMMQETSS